MQSHLPPPCSYRRPSCPRIHSRLSSQENPNKLRGRPAALSRSARAATLERAPYHVYGPYHGRSDHTRTALSSARNLADFLAFWMCSSGEGLGDKGDATLSRKELRPFAPFTFAPFTPLRPSKTCVLWGAL